MKVDRCQSHSHFGPFVVFVVRRKLLKATLLSRLVVESRVSFVKGEEGEGRGWVKRTLLLEDVSSVVVKRVQVADAVCLSGTRVRVVRVLKKFLPVIFHVFLFVI